MAESEFDRKIEVITGILADLTVKHQLAEERMRGMDENAGRIDRRMSRAERILVLTIRAGRRERREWRARYAALVDAQKRTEEALKQLAESQAHTDSRLDALIDIVREGRNGKTE